MSAESHGHVVLAARDGRRLAGLSLVEPSGHMTDDPTPIIVDPYDRNSEQLGAILPLGPKGFGWLILVEVLTGLMSGMGAAKHIPFIQTAAEPWSGGIFLMAINIGNLVDLDAFKSRIDGLIRDIKSSRLAAGFEEIVLPGERALAEAERRRRDGIPVRDEDWAYIERVAQETGVDLEAVRPAQAKPDPAR